MMQGFTLTAAAGQAADGGHFLEVLARGATRLLVFLLERLGFPQAQALIFEEIALHAATSLALLVILLALHILVFSVFRRRRERQREKQGGENHRVLILDAALGPLRFAFWVCGLYVAALPLLLLLDPNHAAYPVRRLIEKVFELGLFAASYWLLYRFVVAVAIWFQRWSGAPAGGFQDSIIEFVGRTLRAVISIAAIISALPLLGLPRVYDHVVAKAISLLIVGAIAWVLFHLVEVGERFVLGRYSMAAADNLDARGVYTQVHILKKTLQVIIAVFALASGLMVFDQVRSLGASVLASAGVLSIIIGFAAQRTIANLFAGFQLALTQPIRLDDVVIVENEWGRIEEVTLTYVVVRLWDMRRLIVPLSYFIEKPFQNWTRSRSDLLGTVFIYADYTVPVDAIREELRRIVTQSSLWDGQVCGLQVTNATERTIELRALASAVDASNAWDLRCEIREKLIAFVQKNFPESLPHLRAEVEPRHASPQGNDSRENPIGFAPSKA
jgi:small-conductance mechanosensitive channel